ncbi:hypothetical protein Thi970DRAFT_01692 [Thiorhodovibrio frisius]|uniref:Uncharacterized protein n=1 Tax=Thiorhodovibrio frisius TaxID=631362 RepID=H8Z1N6_9GAMM|nr:hypothetical protein Thi970DRAFT_01692 [Thiorhodovibrio frisius]WPL24067.1 hypothetical protein Thiofri_04279 [Thiorhodovibrio frisius]
MTRAGFIVIATVVIEEHHEAFLAWLLAAARGWIAPTGNWLLHVDTHADMSLPCLNQSLHSIRLDAVGADRQSLRRFTYEELGIGDFILPALYLGLFERIDWLRPAPSEATHPPPVRAKPLYLASLEGDGRRLRLTANRFQAGLLDPAGWARAHFRSITTQTPADAAVDSRAPSALPWVLDIDLDYFHSDDAAAETMEIQITEAEYRAYRDHPYHRVRLHGGCVRAFCREGQYYYRFARSAPGGSPVFERARVTERIQVFMDWLKRLPHQPSLITVCRSSISGYVPADQVDWLEQQVLDGLAMLYPLRQIAIAELAAEIGS